ncbi:hypothetical protein EJ04DRAFT_585503 [Polyplosphaeria fusca]|uniref:Zn(2)-C6 fungal-type domain-containing protein n=1 Tax=Polyplosphaeria fusca TaxID=682080 RepID=A0A9P4QTG6_9PLEO|nr:hypothetical protein EJ04DRAFT_585503 [Polyplosphaeria fusca]
MKSYDGCWTCRLRKKRCDEIRPVCKNCSALQITCHFGEEKPAWMDSGTLQRGKADQVKREVRNAAARRRGGLTKDPLESTVVIPEKELDAEQAAGGLESTAPMERPPFCAEPGGESRPSWIFTGAQTSTEVVSSDGGSDAWNIASNSADGRLGTSELDRRFMTFYLDHFFPFLFPFYKPSLLEGERATYFVSVALDGAVAGPHVCKTLAWEKLLEQMGVAFTMVQRNIQNITARNVRDGIIETSRIMGSIIQLQRFETSVGNFENCQKHLDAAVMLFRQMFQAAQNVIPRGELPTFYSVLGQMGPPIWTTTPQQRRAWNPNQAAFRFHTALLLVDDIIASTCMGQAPRLLEYHARLLTSASTDEEPPLSLEDFVGCETWVMLQISEIAALESWKKAMKTAGQLDMMELVARASAIKQTLLANLARLDTASGNTAFVTRVWAHAALLYLSLVVSGWQPASASIRESVVRILALLEHMAAPELLRTMVWPYCIVGCMAAPEEEERLRGLVEALVPHRLFGPARKALEIMERVWKGRGEMGVETDLAACVCGLGYAPLLV